MTPRPSPIMEIPKLKTRSSRFLSLKKQPFKPIDKSSISLPFALMPSKKAIPDIPTSPLICTGLHLDRSQLPNSNTSDHKHAEDHMLFQVQGALQRDLFSPNVSGIAIRCSCAVENEGTHIKPIKPIRCSSSGSERIKHDPFHKSPRPVSILKPYLPSHPPKGNNVSFGGAFGRRLRSASQSTNSYKHQTRINPAAESNFYEFPSDPKVRFLRTSNGRSHDVTPYLSSKLLPSFSSLHFRLPIGSLGEYAPELPLKEAPPVPPKDIRTCRGVHYNEIVGVSGLGRDWSSNYDCGFNRVTSKRPKRPSMLRVCCPVNSAQKTCPSRTCSSYLLLDGKQAEAQLKESNSLNLAAALSDATSPLGSVAFPFSIGNSNPEAFFGRTRSVQTKEKSLEEIFPTYREEDPDLSLTRAFQNAERECLLNDYEDTSGMMLESEYEDGDLTVLSGLQSFGENSLGSKVMELDDESTARWSLDPYSEFSSNLMESSQSGDSTPAATNSCLVPVGRDEVLLEVLEKEAPSDTANMGETFSNIGISDDITTRWEGAFLREHGRWASARKQSTISFPCGPNVSDDRPLSPVPIGLIKDPKTERLEAVEGARAEIREKLCQDHVKWAFAQMGVDVEDIMRWEEEGIEENTSACRQLLDVQSVDRGADAMGFEEVDFHSELWDQHPLHVIFEDEIW